MINKSTNLYICWWYTHRKSGLWEDCPWRDRKKWNDESWMEINACCPVHTSVFRHQIVSPGKCGDFLRASLMTSCTWLSLPSPVLKATLNAAFLNQVPLTPFLFKQSNIGGYARSLIQSTSPHALGVFWASDHTPRVPQTWLDHSVLAGT